MAGQRGTGITGGAAPGSVDGSEPPKSLLAVLFSAASLPKLRLGEWVESLLVRVGIPLALALLYYVWGRHPFVGDPANVAGTLGSIAVAWTLHWYYARWRKGLGAKQFRLVLGVGTIFWLGVLIWLAARAMTCVMSLDPTGRNGTWDVLWGQYSTAMAGAGVWGVLAFAALVRLVGMLWRRWRAQVEPTELLWWVDSLVTFALRFVWGVVALSACAVVWTLLDGSWPQWAPLFEGPWWNGTLTFVCQLADAGALGVLLALAVACIVFARCQLALEVRRDLRGHGDQLVIWGGRLLRVAKAVVYGLLVIALAGTALALINPAGPTWLAWTSSIVGAFLPASLVLPGFGVVALRFAWLAYQRWRDAPGRAWVKARASASSFLVGLGAGASSAIPQKRPVRPFPLRALVWLAAAVAFAGLALLIGLALRDMIAQVAAGVGPASVISVAVSSVNAGLAQPNIWGLIAIVVGQIVIAIFVIVVGFIVLGMILGGGGGGGGGGGAAAGGGGGGGGAGFGSSSSEETLRDRYGRKLATVDRDDLFGTRVYDRWGRPIGRERVSFDGSERYEINGHDVRVRDATFGSDKTVSVDGERTGRIHDDSSDGGPWYDDRWK